LIAEDEDILRLVQSKYLRQLGFTVREARSGTEAVDAALRDPPPAVILMDIMMPGMDGVAATAAIRSRSRTPIPVIASTGAVLGDVNLESAEFETILIKPYPLARLGRAVSEALGMKR
jgi:CheY-like chemotaxis protein